MDRPAGPRGNLVALPAALAGRARGALQAAHGRARRIRNRRRSNAAIWRRSLADELAYWAAWLEQRGGPDHPARITDSFEWRIDPNSELQSPLRELVDAHEGSVVSIIDVGAGPLTSVGKTHPERTLRLVAVDPLAREYDRHLERAGIVPPVRTAPGDAERLLESYGRDRFDIAYADNALDHCADPLKAIDNMLAVVKGGGYVVLRHGVNEGERNFYLGLHQWNFNVEDGQLIVWNPQVRHNLNRRLAGQVSLGCRQEPGGLICVLAKTGETSR